MGHKANISFFDAKKPWSRRKDLVLTYYLKPYLNKVSNLHRPITIIDGFAGPGKYKSGDTGSPLLIRGVIQSVKAPKVPISLMCIEQDEDLYGRLTINLATFPDTQAVHASFSDVIPRIVELAKTQTLFIYLDPYTVEGISWNALDQVFAHLRQSRSCIEILLNFNAYSFARRGLAALKMPSPQLDTNSGDAESTDAGDEFDTPISSLDGIVGGAWWQPILRQASGFPEQVRLITDQFCAKLRSRFNEVCEHPIREHWRHTVPKYSLVFGSRSSDALVLVNDAAARSREIFAEQELPRGSLLFESRPQTLVPDTNQLPDLISHKAIDWIKRGLLILNVIRQRFGDFRETEIRRAIQQMVRSGQLITETGKLQINNDVRVKLKQHNSSDQPA